jgi:hypothetical protein
MTKKTMKFTKAMKNGIVPTKNPEILKSKIHSKNSRKQRILKKFREHRAQRLVHLTS